MSDIPKEHPNNYIPEWLSEEEKSNCASAIKNGWKYHGYVVGRSKIPIDGMYRYLSVQHVPPVISTVGISPEVDTTKDVVCPQQFVVYYKKAKIAKPKFSTGKFSTESLTKSICKWCGNTIDRNEECVCNQL
jgi:hypothetical protein